MLRSFEGDAVRLPFWMASTHLMFTQGSINGRTTNFFGDAGLAMSRPLALGSWTIDFDTMSYYFPPDAAERAKQSSGLDRP